MRERATVCSPIYCGSIRNRALSPANHRPASNPPRDHNVIPHVTLWGSFHWRMRLGSQSELDTQGVSRDFTLRNATCPSQSTMRSALRSLTWLHHHLWRALTGCCCWAWLTMLGIWTSLSSYDKLFCLSRPMTLGTCAQAPRRRSLWPLGHISPNLSWEQEFAQLTLTFLNFKWLT